MKIGEYMVDTLDGRVALQSCVAPNEEPDDLKPEEARRLAVAIFNAAREIDGEKVSEQLGELSKLEPEHLRNWSANSETREVWAGALVCKVALSQPATTVRFIALMRNLAPTMLGEIEALKQELRDCAEQRLADELATLRDIISPLGGDTAEDARALRATEEDAQSARRVLGWGPSESLADRALTISNKLNDWQKRTDFLANDCRAVRDALHLIHDTPTEVVVRHIADVLGALQTPWPQAEINVRRALGAAPTESTLEAAKRVIGERAEADAKLFGLEKEVGEHRVVRIGLQDQLQELADALHIGPGADRCAVARMAMSILGAKEEERVDVVAARMKGRVEAAGRVRDEELAARQRAEQERDDLLTLLLKSISQAQGARPTPAVTVNARVMAAFTKVAEAGRAFADILGRRR